MRYAILMYHIVERPQSRAEVRFACPPRLFATHLRSVLARGMTPVSLDAVAAHMAGESPLPDRALVVTLDDGTADAYEVALPILVEQKIPATVFVTTGLVGDRSRWMRANDGSSRAMMTWDQVRALAQAGIGIGSHSLSHPRLTELGDDDLRHEVHDSKARLEDAIGLRVDHFAYPYGRYNKAVQNTVASAGYVTACSTRSGFNTAETDCFALRRLEVFGSDPVWKLWQKITFGTNDASWTQPLRYYTNRIKAQLPSLGQFGGKPRP